MSPRELGPAERISLATTHPTAAFIADTRLATLAVMSVLATLQGVSLRLSLVVLLALPMSWAVLRWWHSALSSLVEGWRFPLSDAVVSGVVLVLAQAVLQVPALAVAYALESAALIAVIRTRRVVMGWLVLFVPVTALARAVSGVGAPWAWYAAAVVAVTATAVSACRFGAQLRTTGVLAAELADTRSREAASEERLAIARDLHDSVAKSVHGIRMLAEAVHADVGGGIRVEPTLTATLLDAADEASREARAVLDGLNTTAQVADLGAHMERQVRTWGARTGHAVSVDVCVSLHRHRPQGRWAWDLERVVGELLANVEKHACASGVRFEAAERDGWIRLDVIDDGRGPGEATDGLDTLVSAGHYGLTGARERLRQLDGTLRVAPRTDGCSGTQATVVLPCP